MSADSIHKNHPSSITPKRGRPSSAKLSRENISYAALEIVDESGWDALTMTALARKLHVRAPSIYHHIESQAELVHLVRQIIVQDIASAELENLGWEDAIRTFGVSYHKAFLKHPNTIQMLSVTPIRDVNTFQMYEAFVSALDRAGWSGDKALEILVAIEYLALGSAFEANAADVMLTAEHAQENNAPVLAKFLTSRSRQDIAVVEDTFLTLLENIIHLYSFEREQEHFNLEQPSR